MATSIKVPPTFDDDTNYEQYKKEVEIWELLLDENDLKPNQMGPALFKTIRSRKAKEKVLELDVKTEIGGEQGMKLILEKLDEIYEIDKDQRIYLALEEFENFKRDKKMDISDFVSTFENKHNKIKNYECVLPDGVLTYKLLKAANLEKPQEQLCRATMRKWEYKEMIKQLKAVFNEITSTSETKENIAIKIEPINMVTSEHCNIAEHQQFYEDEYYTEYDDEIEKTQEDAYYQRSYPGSQRFPRKSQYPHRSYNPQNQNHNNSYVPRSKVNVRDERGNLQKCAICKSIMHFAKDCQHNPKNQQSPSQSNQQQTQNISFLTSGVQEVLFQSTSPLKFEEMACFPVENMQVGVVDCGATSTVMGDENYENFKESLPDDERKELEESETESRIPFKFGYNPLVHSYKKAILPVILNGVGCKLQTEIVKIPLPLLISKPSMKKANTKINLMNDTIEMFGVEKPMIQTESGHYAVSLRGTSDMKNIQSLPSSLQLLLEVETVGDKEKVAKKLHTTLGHPKSTRVIDTLKASGRQDEELFRKLKELDTKCETCQKWGRPHPKPAVSLPLATIFNQTVALDLKVYINNKVYFLHLIDHATRFSQAAVIRSKSQDTIVQAIFTYWIAIFGRPLKFLSDNGGEFVNETFMQMSYKLGVDVKTTGAEAPWSNGLCERHNGIIGEAVHKIIDETGVSVEIALAWAIAAKNSIHNVYGFSPYQLVLGRNPVYPSILDPTPPALEDTTSTKLVADNLNAMHAGRKAFVAAEASMKLKRAMKAKTRIHSNTIYWPRDKVYYKKPDKDEWRGPAVVLGQEGTVVLVKDGGFNYRVHTCQLRLIEDIGNESREECTDLHEKENITGNAIENEKKSENESQEEFYFPEKVKPIIEEEEEAILRIEPEDVPATEPPEVETEKVYTCTKAKELPKINSTILLKSDEDWIPMKILSKAGKVTTPNWHYRNVHYINENKDACIPFLNAEWKRTENILLSSKAKEYNEARKEELVKFKELDIYEEVEDTGQKFVTLKWVDKEKLKDGKTIKKSRLVARGYEEFEFDECKDSPTCHKESLRIMLAISASTGYEIESVDIMSAFLQGNKLQRDVYVLPPKEASTEKLWKLKRALYGLMDASLHWYNRIKDELIKLGLSVSTVDPAVFYKLRNNKLLGVIMSHVDDLLISGNRQFIDQMLSEIKQVFKISNQESTVFKYIGLQIERDDKGIYLHQKSYKNELKEIEIAPERKRETESELTADEKLSLKTAIGQVNWLSTQTCPQISYDICNIATQQKYATINTILRMNKLIRKVKSSDMYLKFPKLNLNNLQILCYCDASFHNLPDGGSQGGMVTLLSDSQSCCPVSWYSKRTKRVAKSALAAETLAVGEGSDHARNIKLMLDELLPSQSPTVVKVYSDSKSLVDTSTKVKSPLDRSIRTDIASIREKIVLKEIELHWISTKLQLADIFTKNGVNSQLLSQTMTEGTPPEVQSN